MKKIIFIIMSVILLTLISCTKTYKVGERVHTNQECFAAINKECYDEMTRYSVDRNEMAIALMVDTGEVFVLPSYTYGEVTDNGVGVYQVNFNGYEKLWVASEFIED